MNNPTMEIYGWWLGGPLWLRTLLEVLGLVFHTVKGPKTMVNLHSFCASSPVPASSWTERWNVMTIWGLSTMVVIRCFHICQMLIVGPITNAVRAQLLAFEKVHAGENKRCNRHKKNTRWMTCFSGNKGLAATGHNFHCTLLERKSPSSGDRFPL